VGLLAILEGAPDVEAFTVTLQDIFLSGSLDAVLVDARSTGNQLIETILRLRREQPGLKIIAMGEPLDPEHTQAVIGSGAKGYLAETAGESEIKMAVEIVLDGSVWAPRKVLARLIEAGSVTDPGSTGADALEEKMTPRERQVLKLLMDGRSNRDIASAMQIDEVTVKAHLGRMLRKTGANNRVELTLRAMEERNSKLTKR
jgi:DNA-binding NarL/FixJ family response regulator